MITEDQLEQLAIQWFQDTGKLAARHPSPRPSPMGSGRKKWREALRTLTPAFSHGEKEEEGRLAGAVRIFGSRQISRQSVAKEGVGYRESPKMLKPPWWAASLLLQHMVDELTEGRALSGSVKLGIRIHGSYRAATHKDSLSVKIKSKGG